jgi:hypothetical protein
MNEIMTKPHQVGAERHTLSDSSSQGGGVAILPSNDGSPFATTAASSSKLSHQAVVSKHQAMSLFLQWWQDEAGLLNYIRSHTNGFRIVSFRT